MGKGKVMVKQHFINNAWREGKGETFTSENPATGEVLWQGKAATEEEVNAAVQAAKTAFLQWAALTVADRIAYLEKFSSILGKERATLAEIIAKETGKP